MKLTFNRKELKYLIDKPTFEMLMQELPKNTNPDKHNKK
jgi:hypothetical protein